MKRHLPILLLLCFFYTGVQNVHAQQSTQAVQLNNLTVNFSHMSPHIGQDFYLAVIDAESLEEKRRFHREGDVTFVVELAEVLEDGRSYHVDFYADNNQNGHYDPPNADHAWRLEIENSSGDESLDFGHQIAFTDIEWKHRLRLSFSGMTASLGQEIILYVRDQATGTYLDTLSIESIAGDEFSMDSYVIGLGGTYRLDFYVDKNENGLYDPPPTDQAWRLTNVETLGDHLLDFAFNQDYTDIFETSGAPSRAEDISHSIFPNPADSYLNISMDEQTGSPISVSILSPAGSVLSRTEVFWSGTLSMDIGFLPAGIYFLQLEGDSRRSFSRFVKQ